MRRCEVLIIFSRILQASPSMITIHATKILLKVFLPICNMYRITSLYKPCLHPDSWEASSIWFNLECQVLYGSCYSTTERAESFYCKLENVENWKRISKSYLACVLCHALFPVWEWEQTGLLRNFIHTIDCTNQ